MAYSQAVFDEATAEMAARRLAARTAAASTREAAIAKIPRLAEIERELAGSANEISQAILKGMASGEGVTAAVAAIRDRNLALQQEMAALLRRAGFAQDNFEPRFACPACQDTGYADGRVCACFAKLLKEKAAASLSQMAHMKLTSFDAVDLSLYPDARDASGLSVRERMAGIVAFCRDYAAGFSTASKSLLLFGPTGTGKTHLSRAIARAAAEKGFSVVYGPAPMLLSRLEKEHFGRAAGDSEETLSSCDLLVLDDLGCEFSGSFMQAALYQIINTRLLSGLPTVISTNLDPEQLQQRYGDAIASRLSGEYVPLMFAGRDIRQLLAQRRMKG